jgi:hypothetical protein
MRVPPDIASEFRPDPPAPHRQVDHVFRRDVRLRPPEPVPHDEDVITADSRRAAIEQHWQASESGDTETEHAIYATDAILDYPQSGERFRSRATIAAQRGGHPADRHFTVRRILGGGDLWVSECIITYDGVPTHSVSIMEFADDEVVHETQYFADTFGAPSWRLALAEPMPEATITKA